MMEWRKINIIVFFPFSAIESKNSEGIWKVRIDGVALNAIMGTLDVCVFSYNSEAKNKRRKSVGLFVLAVIAER